MNSIIAELFLAFDYWLGDWLLIAAKELQLSIWNVTESGTFSGGNQIRKINFPFTFMSETLAFDLSRGKLEIVIQFPVKLDRISRDG